MFTRVLNPNGISIGSVVFTGLTTVADRETDRPRYSVCNNRPHLYICTLCSKKLDHQTRGGMPVFIVRLGDKFAVML